MTALIDLLQSQLERLQAIHQLQESEVKALEQRDAPALERITTEKTELLSALETTDKTLAEHPERAHLEESPDLITLREKIAELLTQVQAQNEANGQLVRLTLGRIQNLKQQLQTVHGDNATTYDQKGNTRSGLSGKGIKA
ncbi:MULTISPECIES: flagella synthesis protein FlgN [Gammaproteobacteria]|uniref:flagella synthesis protein FlgN n=1 Tax=Gammaproteobacteria TaxID=1236 RepID=UPI000DCFB392|nr:MULTISPECIES: flagellar protein FlgN [Gammaproteobacteria]RTE86170.1 flagellar protein FlgN [Aliidiomarina sp. B3213]TCZ91521.1 flagellar protein FlgN [Lysobacter sp. N42]